MKLFSKTTILVATALMPFLVSCQSEPEVGSGLYPEEKEDYSAIAFIDNLGKESYVNFTQIVGTKMLEVPKDDLKFKVRLTTTADKDLTFNIKVDNSKLATKKGVTSLGEDAVNFSTKTVTIKQGETSSKDVVITLNKTSKSLLDMQKEGRIAFTIVPNDGTRISKQYSHYVWNVTKELSYINSAGTLDGKTLIPVTDYTIPNEYNGSNYTQDENGLFKDRLFNFNLNYDDSFIKINLTNEQEVAGFEILLPIKYGFEDVSNFIPTHIIVYGGTDENNMEKLGEASLKKKPTTENEAWAVVFSKPIKLKYLNINPTERFDKSKGYSFISGFKLYK